MRLIAMLALSGVVAAPLLTACATSRPLERQVASWAITLTPEQEVPGPGAAGSSGIAKVRVNAVTGQICYDLSVTGLAAPTAAHIHKGAAGVAGPVAMPLDTPVSGHSQGCANDAALAMALIADPSAYYVNVHDAAHPAGALRAQLARAR
ncbi:MAG: CHRD domain-containing protein [Sphingomonas sp.]